MAKKLPYHLESEQSVLGIIFLDNRMIRTVADILDVEDFYELRHQHIYKAMLELDENKMSIDYTSVGAMLERSQQLAEVGGYPYLISLFESIGSTGHLETYMDLVKDSSLKRQVIETTSRILEMGYTEDIDAVDYLLEAEEKIFALAQKRKSSEFTTLKAVIKEVKEKIEFNRTNKGGLTGLATGYHGLDRATLGFKPEELIIVAARPGMGKSAFAMNIALNVAKHNKQGSAAVAIFSLEMSNEQLGSRMLSNIANVDSTKMKSGALNATEWNYLNIGEQTLSKYNILFDDSAAVTVFDIRAKCRKLKQEDKLDFVIIDYLQLIDGDKRAGSNRQEEVARISRSLKQMGRELKVPIMALSQLSRDVDKRPDKRPVLADLRESGSIEQDADIVLFLYSDDYYNKDSGDSKVRNIGLDIAKNRQGMSGITIDFKFDLPVSRFSALDTEHKERTD